MRLPGLRPAEVANTIDDGVFLNAVVMGRDVQVTLPAEVRPALTGLPMPAPVFTGREDAVAGLVEALRPGRGGISAVAGMAGVGKTELAVHAAARALAEPEWFPGGVLFVDMFGDDPQRRLSAGDALLGWLHAVGVPGEHIPEAEQDRSRLWRSVLDAYTRRGRRLLLIVDNAAAEAQVRPLLPTDDRTPVLVTSRHTLDLDARLLDVDVLDDDAAVELIRDVVALRRGSSDPRLKDDGFGDLAEMCAGLPLALRIAAALLADRRHLRPAALADRLRDEQSRLDGLTREEAAVRSAFDLSYAALGIPQARLFRLLPVNPGPDLATASAAALAGLPEEGVTVLLEDLHRAHLVTEPEPDRWRMHDLIRLHAAEQLPVTPDETGDARQRLLGHYRSTVRGGNTFLHPEAPDDTSVFAGNSQALAWFEAEHANLVSACLDAERHGLDEVMIGFAAELSSYFEFRRRTTDSIAIAIRARDLCRRNGDRQGEATAWRNLGLALHLAYRREEAVAAHTHARRLFEELGNRFETAAAWNHLGCTLTDLHRFDEAVTAHTQARRLFQLLPYPRGEAAAAMNLGTAWHEVRRFEDAISMFDEALVLFRKLGDQRGFAHASNNLGTTLREMGRWDDAITAYSYARDVYAEIGDVYHATSSWGNVAVALAGAGDLDGAVNACEQVLSAFQELGEAHREGTTWCNLGALLNDAGRIEQSIAASERACEILRRTGDQNNEGSAWNNLGNSQVKLGRHQDAVASYERARDCYRLTRDRHREAIAVHNMGLALAQTGARDQARQAWELSRDAFLQTGDAGSAALSERRLRQG